MKKIITTILIAAMMCALTACGSQGGNGAGGAVPETVGQALLQDFEDRVAKNADIDTDELANALLQNEWIKFSGAVMEVEEGLLTGFGNAEIRGFDDGEMFAPMVGTIPFIGYVFELEDGVNADTFMQTLKDNADPRWNICTEAEETTVGSKGDKVLFVMSPKVFEE